jgi:hypothetical protein
MVSERWYHIGLVGTEETGRQVVGSETNACENEADWVWGGRCDKGMRHREGVAWEERGVGGGPTLA